MKSWPRGLVLAAQGVRHWWQRGAQAAPVLGLWPACLLPPHIPHGAYYNTMSQAECRVLGPLLQGHKSYLPPGVC